MSLIGFHRVLIGFGIAFCLVYAGWEGITWWRSGSTGSLVLSLFFLALAVALGVYLSRLRTFVGYTDDDGERRRRDR